MGFTNLVDMRGGMFGAFDNLGALVEAGWAACGFEQTVDGPAERRWEHLSSAD